MQAFLSAIFTFPLVFAEFCIKYHIFEIIKKKVLLLTETQDGVWGGQLLHKDGK